MEAGPDDKIRRGHEQSGITITRRLGLLEYQFLNGIDVQILFRMWRTVPPPALRVIGWFVGGGVKARCFLRRSE